MSKNSKGIIVRIQGPVVDVKFATNSPSINEALVLETKEKKKLVLEVAFITGDSEVRALAMGPTEGLSRGMSVQATGSPIKVHV
ncbi:MAG: F0F1 ATP synthase subunit beta, partial [Patescibacteria group bacterium]